MLSLFAYVLVVVGALCFAYLLGLLNGALYVPTDTTLVTVMLDAAALHPGDRLVDLGSGDGRLVIAAASRGIPAVGFEINPLLVWMSRRAIRRAGLTKLARIEWKDFWSVDLSPYSVVMVFGISHIMRRLGRKLERELTPGSRVVCNLFQLPDWEGTKVNGVFVYRR